MNSQIKKSYIAPELITHGNVEKITLQGNRVNADTPNGTPNTGFCPATGNCVPAIS